jgi:penicillin-binding protein 1C
MKYPGHAGFSRLNSWFRSQPGKLWRLKFNLPRWFRRTLLISLASFLLFLLMDLLFPCRVNIRYSQLILDKDDNLLHAFLSEDQKWRMKCELEEVNPLLVSTIIRKEDRWFRYHPGINPVSVIRALAQNMQKGQRVSGASTITMQVARLLHPAERNLWNKFRETFRAIQLEFHYSKSEILEFYLNLLPYGGNIEGVKSASFLYFGQKPQALSTAQMVTLTIIPNNPQFLLISDQNERVIRNRNQWINRLSGMGWINSPDASSAILEPLNVRRLEAPRKVPHLASRLRLLFPGKETIRTFLNPQLQAQVEELLLSEISHLQMTGITNAAVVVLNNRTHGIEAYAGSADFNNTQYDGQVDGANALRSPGSALKPFLYVAAMDMGLITPRSVLCDVPSDFDGYCPENYDQTYRGEIPASQALALSLNVPAIALAEQMGIQKFIDLLSSGGLKWIARNKKSLGLSVVLGGCGVTLLELTSLYQSLALNGLHFPVAFDRETPLTGIDTLFSAESTWLATEMLTNLKRPDLPNQFDNSLHLPHIAWKTGTSYGRRDAWSIGYNPEYTIGIWVGNFDGTGTAELSGSEHAAPLLFRIFNLLSLKQQPQWFRQPPGLDFRLVCSESGLPPNDFCENLVSDHYIPLISRNRKCNHLREIHVNPSGTLSYCRSCLPRSGYRTELYPNHEPSLISYFESQQIPYKKIPQHNPDCSRVYKDENPRITSLHHDREYILYSTSGQQLQLACLASADVARVYWYINDRFYRAAKPNDHIFFTPDAGRIKISCSDDKGRNTDMFILVTYL